MGSPAPSAPRTAGALAACGVASGGGEGAGRQAGRFCHLSDITPPSNHVVAPTVQMWKLRLSLGLA